MDGSGRPWGSESFDFKNPDYAAVFVRRLERLAQLRSDPGAFQVLRAFYKDNPARFIDDWGVTHDPRNPEVGLPSIIPFILYPRQREWIDYVVRKWRAREPGLTEKSREVGVSWLAVSLAATLCLFHDGISIGFGSRKEEYVDKIGEPKSLFWKARAFLKGLPVELRGGWVESEHSPHMRIIFPQSGSMIGGEGGDQIGRGDRRSIYIVDEAAHLEHPESVDAALSMTTNCRMDVSSVNGRANSFARRRFSGTVEVFTFHWRDDPRKDAGWYVKKSAEIGDPVIVAQELDIDYSASTEGVLIPSAWVQSAVDAHRKLGIEPTGAKFGALDVADEGVDKNALCGAHGILVGVLEEWSGKGGDIFATVERAVLLCDRNGYRDLRYDADGLGAGVRGDARIINARRDPAFAVRLDAFRGSGSVVYPERQDIKGRKNLDMFANAKAQAWWALRTRFQRTHRWVTEGISCHPDEIISLSGSLPLISRLCVELSQPTWTLNPAGKMLIEKTPDGARSPNLADSVMIRYAPMVVPMVVPEAVLERMRRGGR